MNVDLMHNSNRATNFFTVLILGIVSPLLLLGAGCSRPTSDAAPQTLTPDHTPTAERASQNVAAYAAMATQVPIRDLQNQPQAVQYPHPIDSADSSPAFPGALGSGVGGEPKVYADPLNRFEVTYPGHFLAMPNRESPDAVHLVDMNGSTRTTLPLSVNILVQEGEGELGKMTEAGLVMFQERSGFTDAAIVMERDLMINGFPAVEQLVTYSAAGRPMATLTAYIQHPRRTLAVSLMSTGAEIQGLSEDFHTILQGVRLR